MSGCPALDSGSGNKPLFQTEFAPFDEGDVAENEAKQEVKGLEVKVKAASGDRKKQLEDKLAIAEKQAEQFATLESRYNELTARHGALVATYRDMCGGDYSALAAVIAITVKKIERDVDALSRMKGKLLKGEEVHIPGEKGGAFLPGLDGTSSEKLTWGELPIILEKELLQDHLDRLKALPRKSETDKQRIANLEAAIKAHENLAEGGEVTDAQMTELNRRAARYLEETIKPRHRRRWALYRQVEKAERELQNILSQIGNLDNMSVDAAQISSLSASRERLQEELASKKKSAVNRYRNDERDYQQQEVNKWSRYVDAKKIAIEEADNAADRGKEKDRLRVGEAKLKEAKAALAKIQDAIDHPSSSADGIALARMQNSYGIIMAVRLSNYDFAKTPIRQKDALAEPQSDVAPEGKSVPKSGWDKFVDVISWIYKWLVPFLSLIPIVGDVIRIGCAAVFFVLFLKDVVTGISKGDWGDIWYNFGQIAVNTLGFWGLPLLNALGKPFATSDLALTRFLGEPLFKYIASGLHLTWTIIEHAIDKSGEDEAVPIRIEGEPGGPPKGSTKEAALRQAESPAELVAVIEERDHVDGLPSAEEVAAEGRAREEQLDVDADMVARAERSDTAEHVLRLRGDRERYRQQTVRHATSIAQSKRYQSIHEESLGKSDGDYEAWNHQVARGRQFA